MNRPGPDTFFIGWSEVPRSLRPFLIGISGILIVLFLGLALVIGAVRPDPGTGSFRYDWEEQSVTGVLTGGAYPTLSVTSGTDRIPAGQTLMLSGPGKRGVQEMAAGLDGVLVDARGIVIERGSLRMLQVRGDSQGLSRAHGSAVLQAPPQDEDLGLWRVTGEICDGKCFTGAMRPGSGLAHKACAVLCIDGGAPPVLVTAQPVAGSSYLLLTPTPGTVFGDRLGDLVARLVTLDGRIWRRGDLMIFETDLEAARLVN